ncbi:Spherulation-specific family 4-domain-containing protein [Tribonema minus]|uniref:Spherulation-specific family 4-domain-containing protein n=1 Tax=Tribonema minus TaxID=303371 RepID=A0A835YZP6_9STRA|nr:Spherulation-specific family 4-domain-containing protein [Tribonema minus]
MPALLLLGLLPLLSQARELPAQHVEPAAAERNMDTISTWPPPPCRGHNLLWDQGNERHSDCCHHHDLVGSEGYMQEHPACAPQNMPTAANHRQTNSEAYCNPQCSADKAPHCQSHSKTNCNPHRRANFRSSDSQADHCKAHRNADSRACCNTKAYGTIIPLYTFPGTDSNLGIDGLDVWHAIAAAHTKYPSVPVKAVVNVNNGPCALASTVLGRACSACNPPDQSFYNDTINALASSGVTVLGYVSTNYGGVSAAQAQDNVQLWKKCFGSAVGGVFFDEMSTDSARTSYYSGLSSFAASIGLDVTVGNAGTDTLPAYVGTVDHIIVYESAGLPAPQTLAAGANPDRAASVDNFAVIPYGVASDMGAVSAATLDWIRAAKPYVGHFYVTPDTLSNPWDNYCAAGDPYPCTDFDGLLHKLCQLNGQCA